MTAIELFRGPLDGAMLKVPEGETRQPQQMKLSVGRILPGANGHALYVYKETLEGTCHGEEGLWWCYWFDGYTPGDPEEQSKCPLRQ